MPRGVRGSSAKKGTSTGPPPSHPAETFREHRKFLIRSLERNDVDMSALVELNKTLHSAKQQILDSCGEGVLLDLGTGRLRLSPTNDDELIVHDEETTKTKTPKKKSPGLTPEQKETCVDFLLRMKLRRKLSNRLMRRLTRLAHAMDGKDVSPPGPPKYGDSRLKIDPKIVEAKAEEWKVIESAKEQIDAAIRQWDVATIEHGLAEDKTENPNAGEAAAEGGPPNSPDETQSGEKPESEEPVNCSEKTVGREAPQKHYTIRALIDDFKVIREYESAYQKHWDEATKSFKYSKGNEDIDDPKAGGIGASAVFSTIEDLKTERKRWETNILRKIPEQPSTEELGLKNRVFQLEERRKRCLDKTATDEGTASTGESPVKKRKIDNEEKGNDEGRKGEVDDDDNMDVDDEDKGEENSDSEGEEEQETKRKDTVEEDMAPKRSISFAPTPSFHDQDLLRIRYIHRDLLNSSQIELTRKRFSDATEEYNKAYQFSTNLFEARKMIQHNLTFAIAKGRQELTKAHSDYTIAYTTAKQRWTKEKFEYDLKKTQAVLPTKWGKQPLGTEWINRYMQQNITNIQRTTVGQTLADIVDGCILGAEGKANIQPFRNFVPPPAPGMDAQTGENMAQRQHRIEMEYRKQYGEIDAKLQKSEADRARAWRKAMKAQAENNAVCNVRGSRVTVSNYHSIPVPVIRSGVPPGLPPQMTYQQRTQVYSAPTTTTSSSGSTVDMSKYSAEKVKLRKSADGSVAPVSKPKKDKDGLYLRPAGRTRKGMQWDAVNGVWVPQQQQS